MGGWVGWVEWLVVHNSLSGRGEESGGPGSTGLCQLLLFPRIIRLLSAGLLVIKELF